MLSCNSLCKSTNKQTYALLLLFFPYKQTVYILHFVIRLIHFFQLRVEMRMNRVDQFETPLFQIYQFTVESLIFNFSIYKVLINSDFKMYLFCLVSLLVCQFVTLLLCLTVCQEYVVCLLDSDMFKSMSQTTTCKNCIELYAKIILVLLIIINSKYRDSLPFI